MVISNILEIKIQFESDIEQELKNVENSALEENVTLGAQEANAFYCCKTIMEFPLLLNICFYTVTSAHICFNDFILHYRYVIMYYILCVLDVASTALSLHLL